MALNPSQTYIYVDAALNTFTVLGSTLNFRGYWNISGFYNKGDVVQIGQDLYIARASSQGQSPTSILDSRWSTLVEVTQANGSISQSGTDTYARNLAQQAYSLGVQNGTEIAYILTQLGTSSGTGGGDGVLATDAWVLAQYGTNTGTAAYNLASSAYVLAEYGTNTGTYALQVAQEALAIAIIGTNTSGGAAALTLAEYATNTGTYALQVAQEALSIACIGTNTGTYALKVAQEALSIAIIGTNTGTAAYVLAEYGTNTGTYALQVAQEALAIAIIGTNNSSAPVGRALVLCAAYTPLSVGADTAEVPIPYDVTGTGSVAWTLRRTTLRVQTAGTGPSVMIEKSPGNGAFSATVVTPTVSLGVGAYEASVTGTGTMASGDKCRFNVLSLGTAQNWTVVVELSHP